MGHLPVNENLIHPDAVEKLLKPWVVRQRQPEGSVPWKTR
jgi:hypothetical protein